MSVRKYFDGKVYSEELLGNILAYFDNLKPTGCIEDHGIGPYEFWGTPGNDVNLVLVTNNDTVPIYISNPTADITEILDLIASVDEVAEETGSREISASHGNTTLTSTFNLKRANAYIEIGDNNKIAGVGFDYEWRD